MNAFSKKSKIDNKSLKLRVKQTEPEKYIMILSTSIKIDT